MVNYHPNPKKTVLIVKNEHELKEAKDLFHSTYIKITTEGERHLGAVVGSHKFWKEYIKEKVDAWLKDVKELAQIAEFEPQLTYSAFTM